ncbi:zinc finger protein 142 isoform X1 [Corythoichthys intestinalis]|uniref:zinc finger protein 142 isoform X1 n=2 Tax=Corythoichthys intestinalis TaxID=161448 RepID=UPI0025A5F6B8|nr:zinc finger protein 142 isoform X1 [Corythoichthys intestinalis]
MDSNPRRAPEVLGGRKSPLLGVRTEEGAEWKWTETLPCWGTVRQMPPTRLKRVLPHHEKIQLLDLLREGKSYAEVARHYELNESTVRYIKKREMKIRMSHTEQLEMKEPLDEETRGQKDTDAGQPTCNVSERCLRSFKGSSECTDVAPQPQVSTEKTKRKRHPNLPDRSSATTDVDEAEIEVVVVEEEDREQDEEYNAKKAKTQTDSPTIQIKAESQLPSQDYSAEDAEHVYDKHICQTCQRCFKMRSHLQEHLLSHFPDQGLQCPTCERFFSSRSKLRVHQLREEGKKDHHCHLCEYSAVEHNAIRRHLITVHADEMEEDPARHRYPCITCGKSFGQSGSLKAHMKTHHVRAHKTAVKCFHDGCPFRSHLRRVHMRHFEEEHGTAGVGCRHHTCVAVFPSKKHMEDHFKTHLAYHCSQCDFSCSNKAAFLQHQRQGHNGSEKLCCEFCDYFTFNPVELKRHIWHLHSNEKTHRCSLCSYMTSHKTSLTRHMLTHNDEKPYKCQLCDFRCRDESYLSKHMITHSGERNFLCEECGYVTKWKHYLNIHMRKHAGDLRYECDQCSYRCHRMDQLNSHKLRHQSKSLMCEICAYACKRKCELRNHMLAKHSVEGNSASVHKCKYCEYTTCFKQALQNHENCKHTRLKQYYCALCPYFSFSSISLFLHKKKTHGYVPGDKAWLENYAAKDRERNSKTVLRDSVMSYEGSGMTTEVCIPMEQSNPDAPVAEIAGEAHSQAGPSLDADSLMIKEGTSEGISHSPQPGASPEYCTLVLTTLTPDCETIFLPNEDSTSDIMPSNTDSANEKEAIFLSTISSKEDEVTTVRDGENSLCGSDTAIPDTPPEKNRNINPTKIQAEALVLDGRIQLLAVPSQDVYRCDQCSYVTKKEKTLQRHRRALCHGRQQRLKCQACGTQFKQRRGFDDHLANKCPKTFIGKAAKQIEDNSIASQETCEKVAKVPSQPTGISAEVNHLDGRIDSASTASELESNQNRDGDKSSSRNLTNTGKFKCNFCSFSSVKLATVDRHIFSCQKREKNAQKVGGKQKVEKGYVSESRPGIALPLQEKTDVIQSPTCASKPTHLDQKSVAQDGRKAQNQNGSISPHTCRYCSFTTSRRYRLEEHESLHTGSGRHACDICDKTFGAATKLRQHKVRIHHGKPALPCGFCDYCGYTADDVRRHTRRCHTGDSHHNCTDCEACFSSKAALRNHHKRAHQLRPRFACEQCNYVCNSETILRKHQQSEHRETFKVKVDRRIHLTHECQLCSFTGKSKQLLSQHLLDEHEESSLDKPLQCGSCTFTCRHALVLEQHLRSHGGKRVYKCTDCKYSTGNKQKITWHVRIHTGEKPYRCEHCSYTCVDPSRLKLHMRVHQDEKKYLCPECGYKCKWATQLKYHMTKHTGEKPFTCDQCEYRTNRADALRAHQTTQHCDVRAFVCEKCGKAFKTNFILKTHQRQHGDQSSYACGVCHKAFRWPAGLRHHFLTHTEQLPFRCCHCSYRAKQRFQVVKHLQRHHPGTSVEQGVERDSDIGGLTLKTAMQGTLNDIV